MSASTAIGSWMLDHLPNHLRADEFFCRFVDAFGGLAEGTFDHADAMPFLADPTLTPMAMVHHLASWMGADVADRSAPPERHRDLLARIGPLLGRRGTRQGLIDLLTVLTDGEVEVTDDGGVFASGEVPPNARVVTVRLSTVGTEPVEHLVDVIRDEIPADCTLQLWVAGRSVDTRPRAERSRR